MKDCGLISRSSCCLLFQLGRVFPEIRSFKFEEIGKVSEIVLFEIKIYFGMAVHLCGLKHQNSGRKMFIRKRWLHPCPDPSGAVF